MTLFAIDHDNVAIFIFRQHGIAGYFEGNGLFRNREGKFDLAEALRGDLLVLRFDRGAGADPAHDRHRVQFEIFDDRGDFGRLDQTYPGENFRDRAGANAHGGRQATLGFAWLLQSPLDQSDFQKSSLTSISEYQKLPDSAGQR